MAHGAAAPSEWVANRPKETSKREEINSDKLVQFVDSCLLALCAIKCGVALSCIDCYRTLGRMGRHENDPRDGALALDTMDPADRNLLGVCRSDGGMRQNPAAALAKSSVIDQWPPDTMKRRTFIWPRDCGACWGDAVVQAPHRVQRHGRRGAECAARGSRGSNSSGEQLVRVSSARCQHRIGLGSLIGGRESRWEAWQATHAAQSANESIAEDNPHPRACWNQSRSATVACHTSPNEQVSCKVCVHAEPRRRTQKSEMHSGKYRNIARRHWQRAWRGAHRHRRRWKPQAYLDALEW